MRPHSILKSMTRTLVVVDVQESFRRSERWDDIADPQIAAKVGRLVDAFRASGDPVVWILHTEPGSGGAFDPANGLIEILSELTPAENEPVLTKTTVSAFASTDLAARLRATGTDEVVVCGIRTEQCCETTTRDGADLGFAMSFVLDATTTNPVGGLTAAQIIERTVVVLAGRGFATVTTVDDVVAAAVAP